MTGILRECTAGQCVSTIFFDLRAHWERVWQVICVYNSGERPGNMGIGTVLTFEQSRLGESKSFLGDDERPEVSVHFTWCPKGVKEPSMCSNVMYPGPATVSM